MFIKADTIYAYLLTFTAQLNNKRLHINRILAFLLLCVFAIALTPWSSLHHHEEQHTYCSKEGAICMHKVHVGSEQHNCLICSAHFTKDLISSVATFRVSLSTEQVIRTFTLINSSYVALISTSLRGPPLA